MLELEIQRLVNDPTVPKDEQIEQWARAALAGDGQFIVNLRIVDEAESWALNRQWRGRDSSTNVLSFPASSPDVNGQRVLGDVVLCAPVIAREAAKQGKSIDQHWAHLVIHGLLHLLGYDHIDGGNAEVMETREIELLAGLGISNPYELQNDP